MPPVLRRARPADVPGKRRGAAVRRQLASRLPRGVPAIVAGCYRPCAPSYSLGPPACPRLTLVQRGHAGAAVAVKRLERLQLAALLAEAHGTTTAVHHAVRLGVLLCSGQRGGASVVGTQGNQAAQAVHGMLAIVGPWPRRPGQRAQACKGCRAPPQRRRRARALTTDAQALVEGAQPLHVVVASRHLQRVGGGEGDERLAGRGRGRAGGAGGSGGARPTARAAFGAAAASGPRGAWHRARAAGGCGRAPGRPEGEPYLAADSAVPLSPPPACRELLAVPVIVLGIPVHRAAAAGTQFLLAQGLWEPVARLLPLPVCAGVCSDGGAPSSKFGPPVVPFPF